MPELDPMNVDGVLEKLDTALGLQYRSVLEMTVVAGSLTGVQWQSLEPLVTSYAEAELEDTRRLVQKVVSLGGAPASAPAPFEASLDPEKALVALVDHECEALAALHAVLPDTGQEPRSEALEHRLEHLIMRKNEQVDTLRRVLGRMEDG
jgi:bacterioferritin (cytochrome b1)